MTSAGFRPTSLCWISRFGFVTKFGLVVCWLLEGHLTLFLFDPAFKDDVEVLFSNCTFLLLLSEHVRVASLPFRVLNKLPCAFTSWSRRPFESTVTKTKRHEGIDDGGGGCRGGATTSRKVHCFETRPFFRPVLPPPREVRGFLSLQEYLHHNLNP